MEHEEVDNGTNLPESVAIPAAMTYRSVGLGVYAVVVRYATMPMEKTAMIMNSSQVSGSNQMSKCMRIVFAQGPMAPYLTVGRSSVVAWFFQYSVMGFVFQMCDRYVVLNYKSEVRGSQPIHWMA